MLVESKFPQFHVDNKLSIINYQLSKLNRLNSILIIGDLLNNIPAIECTTKCLDTVLIHILFYSLQLREAMP